MNQKYWELCARDLSAAGWSWGHASILTTEGRELFVVDAHRGDGRRFVVQAEDLNTAFVELEAQCRAALAGGV